MGISKLKRERIQKERKGETNVLMDRESEEDMKSSSSSSSSASAKPRPASRRKPVAELVEQVRKDRALVRPRLGVRVATAARSGGRRGPQLPGPQMWGGRRVWGRGQHLTSIGVRGHDQRVVVMINRARLRAHRGEQGEGRTNYCHYGVGDT